MTRCFYDKKEYPAYQLLEEYQQDLLHNKNTIKVTDFGAGSRVFSSNKRKISAISKHVGISGKRAKFLYRLINYTECRNVLELGTSLGIATAALAANKSTKVTTIEGCPETAKIAQQQFKKYGLENIELQIGEFEEILENLSGSAPLQATNTKQQTANPRHSTGNIRHKTFDLIYFDGNHKKEPTLEYFHQLIPTAHNDSIFIFDDIHWSAEMESAWEEIKAHPSVKVSIDTFHLGLVFFRKEQAKQHFRIRL